MALAEERRDFVSANFSIKRADDARGVVLVLTGELDLASADEFASALTTMSAEAKGRVLLDLSGVTFMDSSGLGVLVRAHQEAEVSGRPLVLRRPTAQVRRLLEVVGLIDRLTFE